MNIEYLLPELNNLWISYLDPNECIYYGGDWSKFPRDEICNIAAQYNWLNLLKHARQNINGNVCPWDETTCAKAAEYNNLDILKWAYDNGCPWNSTVYEYAAQCSNFDILDYAYKKKCPWNIYVCQIAARCANLDVLKWARMRFSDNKYLWDFRTCFEAAYNGHFDVSDWLRENGCACGGGTFHDESLLLSCSFKN